MSQGASCRQPAAAKRSILPGHGREREMQNGGGQTTPRHRLRGRIQPLSPGSQQTLGLCSRLGGSGCSSPWPEPDWQVCLCEPSRPRLPGAPCWTLATGHWPAGSWCRPARVSHTAPRHPSDFLLPGPTTREQPQADRQPRARQAPRRAGGARTRKWGAQVTAVRIPNAHQPQRP